MASIDFNSLNAESQKFLTEIGQRIEEINKSLKDLQECIDQEKPALFPGRIEYDFSPIGSQYGLWYRSFEENVEVQEYWIASDTFC